MDSIDLSDLRHALVQNCGLTPVHAPASDRESLVAELAARVDYLLRHDTEKLMFYLYRLDVSEAQFADAISPDASESPARAIAESILEREARRLQTYKRFVRPDHEQLEFDDQSRDS